MKKISYIAFMAIAAWGFTACNADTDPKLDTGIDYEFVLNTPPLASQFIDLENGSTLQFTVSQPQYGLTVAPTYGIQISLTRDFEPLNPGTVTDAEGEEHVIQGSYNIPLESSLAGVLLVSTNQVAAGINELNGVFDESTFVEDYVGPVYVRATAYLGGDNALNETGANIPVSESTFVVSNVIELSQVKSYFVVINDDALILCVPGNGNGWTNSPENANLVSTDEGVTYKGFAYIDLGFKVTDGDWDDPNWGAWKGDWGDDPETGLTEGLSYDADSDTYTGPLYFNGSNLNDSGAGIPSGLYYIVVDVKTMEFKDNGVQGATITLTPVKSVCIQGDYCGWNFDNAVEMTAEDNTTFKATGSFTSAGWKFAMNGDWAINLGGNPKELTFDGDNLTLEGSTITLNLEQYPWNCTVQ